MGNDYRCHIVGHVLYLLFDSPLYQLPLGLALPWEIFPGLGPPLQDPSKIQPGLAH